SWVPHRRSEVLHRFSGERTEHEIEQQAEQQLDVQKRHEHQAPDVRAAARADLGFVRKRGKRGSEAGDEREPAKPRMKVQDERIHGETLPCTGELGAGAWCRVLLTGAEECLASFLDVLPCTFPIS